jgi:cell division protein FtsZ
VVTHGANFSLKELNAIAGYLKESARPGVEIVPGLIPDESLKDGIRVTIIATGFDAKKHEEAATVIDLKNFVNPNFNTGKAVMAQPAALEELEGEMGLKLTEGQYEIPAYMRRRLAGKPFQN